ARSRRTGAAPDRPGAERHRPDRHAGDRPRRRRRLGDGPAADGRPPALRGAGQADRAHHRLHRHRAGHRGGRAHRHAGGRGHPHSPAQVAAARRPGSQDSGECDRMSRLLRASAIMAAGTMVSRVTGFIRTMVLAYAIGTALLGDAYNVAYAIPYSILDLLLLGVLSSVVVPMIVKAQQRDPDGGRAYEQRLLTLATVALIVVAAAAVLAAPLIIDLYTEWDRADRQFEVAVRLAQFILPQLAFFGIGAVAGAILNTRDRFAAPMWAPVVNNLVVICVLVVYAVIVTDGSDLATVTNGELALLGLGTTAGIVAQATVLVIALKRAGFRFVARFDLRNARLGEMSRMGVWTIGYVIVTQLGF